MHLLPQSFALRVPANAGTAKRGLTQSWILLAVLFLAMTGAAKAQFDWNGNAGNTVWSKKGAWTGNAAPATGVASVFTFTKGSSFAAANDLTGIIASSITFGSGTNVYTLSGNSINLTGIVQNNSSVLQTISMPLVLTNATAVAFNAATGGLTVSSIISESGSSNVTINSTAASTGVVTLSGANTFTGTLTIDNGTLSANTIVVAGSASSLGNATSAVVLGDGSHVGTLSYTGAAATFTRGFTVTSGGGGGALVNTTGNLVQMSTGGIAVGSGSTMTLGATATGGITVNSGSVISGAGNLAVNSSGSGVVTLNSANNLSGTTTVSAGTLSIGTGGNLSATTGITVNTGGTLLLSGTNNDKINNSATVTLAGGTLSLGGSASLSESVGVLTLSSTSTIDFGTLAGGNSLTFANSSGASWSGTLNVYNWTQGTDHLFFGSTDSGLTSTQLGHINFYSDSGTTLLGTGGGGKFGLGTGEVRPAPEPSALLVGVGLCLLVCYREGWFMRRRRLPRATKTA